jgi:hypothetical protein
MNINKQIIGINDAFNSIFNNILVAIYILIPILVILYIYLEFIVIREKEPLFDKKIFDKIYKEIKDNNYRCEHTSSLFLFGRFFRCKNEAIGLNHIIPYYLQGANTYNNAYLVCNKHFLRYKSRNKIKNYLNKIIGNVKTPENSILVDKRFFLFGIKLHTIKKNIRARKNYNKNTQKIGEFFTTKKLKNKTPLIQLIKNDLKN